MPVWTGRIVPSSACWGETAPRRRLRPVGADHPDRKELRGTAVGVAQRTAHTVHLMVAGLAAHLHRRLTETDHARRTDRVGRQHPAGHVHRQLPVGAGGTRLGQLPASPTSAKPRFSIHIGSYQLNGT